MFNLDDSDYIKTIDGIKFNFKRIRLCSLVIYYSHDNLSDPGILEKIKTINKEFTKFIISDKIKTTFDLDENLEVEEYNKINKEVLFVKYDPDNMKYLYMCVNCGTSW